MGLTAFDGHATLQELANAQQEAARAHKATEAKARDTGPSAPSNLHEAQARLEGILLSAINPDIILFTWGFLYNIQGLMLQPLHPTVTTIP